jgi:hypothetical protein
MPLIPEMILGRYEVRSRLGAGGMGFVDLSKDGKLQWHTVTEHVTLICDVR